MKLKIEQQRNFDYEIVGYWITYYDTNEKRNKDLICDDTSFIIYFIKRFYEPKNIIQISRHIHAQLRVNDVVHVDLNDFENKKRG